MDETPNRRRSAPVHLDSTGELLMDPAITTTLIMVVAMLIPIGVVVTLVSR